MDRHKTPEQWQRVTAALDGSVRHHHAQQQRLFRLLQCMRAGDWEQAAELTSAGAPLDLPLLLREKDGAVPRAEQFEFPELPAITAITPLGWAAGRGDMQAMQWLVKQGASLIAPFSGARDPAWLAMELRQIPALRWLLDQGVPVNHRLSDPLSTTRLIAATKDSNLFAVEELVRRKANVGLFDREGRTALHYNFMKNPYTEDDQQIGRLLIDWGGSTTAEDKDGQRPADFAQTDAQYALMRLQGLERTLPREPLPPAAEPALDAEEPFDPKKIIRPEEGDPGIPQLNKVPIFKKPRF